MLLHPETILLILAIAKEMGLLDAEDTLEKPTYESLCELLDRVILEKGTTEYRFRTEAHLFILEHYLCIRQAITVTICGIGGWVTLDVDGDIRKRNQPEDGNFRRLYSVSWEPNADFFSVPTRWEYATGFLDDNTKRLALQIATIPMLKKIMETGRGFNYVLDFHQFLEANKSLLSPPMENTDTPAVPAPTDN